MPISEIFFLSILIINSLNIKFQRRRIDFIAESNSFNSREGSLRGIRSKIVLWLSLINTYKFIIIFQIITLEDRIRVYLGLFFFFGSNFLGA